jgi:diguanylate cyclase
MGYLTRTKEEAPLDMERFIAEIRSNAKRKVFHLNAIRTLLVFIKGFSVVQKEIDSDRFVKQLDDLSETFAEEKDVKSVESIFERYKKIIPAFIERQKAYLLDREKEIWDIIELQRTAITGLNSENRDYNRKMYEQSEKIEAITLLDDIKSIKKRLKKEVERIQETVRKKQEQDRRQMEALAKQIDILNLELKKARTKGMMDDLTKVYNRGAFDNYLRKMVDQNTIKPSPFSLLMLDIDDFKKINDDYGHPTGDRVLVALAGKCNELIREQDFLARYGGEEFAIILPGASLRNAVKKAQHLRKAIAGTRYTRSKKEKGEAISITISIGVSSLAKNDSASTVIDRADKALYQAKKAGKNRVVSEAILEAEPADPIPEAH